MWLLLAAVALFLPDYSPPMTSTNAIAVVSDSLRQIPEHLRGATALEFEQFLTEGLIRPHHLRLGPGESARQAFARLFEAKSPAIGSSAPNVPLLDPAAARMVELEELEGDRPLLIVFGSYSCPAFRSQLTNIEKISESGDLRVVIIYTLEAHPTDENSYVRGTWLGRVNTEVGLKIRQHRSLAERSAVALNPPKDLETDVRVLVDPMKDMEIVDELADVSSSNPDNNPAWKAYGLLPNSAFLIDVDGRIAFKTAWFDREPMLLAAIWKAVYAAAK